jgi:hypothetical protein
MARASVQVGHVVSKFVGIAALAAVAAGACASERDAPPPSNAERSAALELVAQMSALYELSLDPTDQNRLIASVRFDAAATLLASSRTDAGWTTPAPTAALPDCVTATDTTATFSGCEVGGHWVDGTISRAGTTVNAEIIDVFILDAGSQGATSVDGALALTRTFIDGAVNIDASWTQHEEDIVLHAAVIFDGVTLDDAGCPIGGSMSIAGSQSTPPRVADRTVQFGPECGDIQISR